MIVNAHHVVECMILVSYEVLCKGYCSNAKDDNNFTI